MDSLFSNSWQELPATDCNDFGWLKPWINDKGSLTEKLRSICIGELRVEVLHHTFVASTEKAADALSITTGDSVLHREVMLCDDKTPLVFASSLLPESALVGRFEELRQLGSRPLGHWIFSEPILTRAEMLTIELPSDAHLFTRLAAKPRRPQIICGRKTLFTGPAKPFLVSEFFLPDLQDRA